MEQKGIRMYSHLPVDIAHEPGIKGQQAYLRKYLRKYKAYALTLVRLCAINCLKKWYCAKELFTHIFQAT